MDPETVSTLISVATAVCLMVLLYGAWVCIDHLAARDKPPGRPAPPQQANAGLGESKAEQEG